MRRRGLKMFASRGRRNERERERARERERNRSAGMRVRDERDIDRQNGCRV
jgi:hypothetical protein